MSEIYDTIKNEAIKLFPHQKMGQALLVQGQVEEAIKHLDIFYEGALDLVDKYGEDFAACVVLCNAGGFRSQINNKLGLPLDGFFVAWETFSKTAPTFIKRKNIEGCKMMVTLIPAALINFNEAVTNEPFTNSDNCPREAVFQCYESLFNIYYQLINTLKQLDPSSESTINLVQSYNRNVPEEFTPDSTFDLYDADELSSVIELVDNCIENIQYFLNR